MRSAQMTLKSDMTSTWKGAEEEQWEDRSCLPWKRRHWGWHLLWVLKNEERVWCIDSNCWCLRESKKLHTFFSSFWVLDYLRCTHRSLAIRNLITFIIYKTAKRTRLRPTAKRDKLTFLVRGPTRQMIHFCMAEMSTRTQVIPKAEQKGLGPACQDLSLSLAYQKSPLKGRLRKERERGQEWDSGGSSTGNMRSGEQHSLQQYPAICSPIALGFSMEHVITCLARWHMPVIPVAEAEAVGSQVQS